MSAIDALPFDYRADPDVPSFDESRPLFVFDGACVLCSRGARWLLRHDPDGKIALTPADGEIGAALYRHYGLSADETYLFVRDGRAFGKSEGYFQVIEVLGGWPTLFNILRIVPRLVLDRAYDWIARNRYRWFGRVDSCSLLTETQRQRLV